MYEQVKKIAGKIIERTATIARLNREEEQGRIRGGRIAVEATLVAGGADRASREGQRVTGKGIGEGAEVAQEEALRQYADAEGLLFSAEDIQDMSDFVLPFGAEAKVYKSRRHEKRVIKVVNYKIFSESALEYLDNRITLHNYIFPFTAYTLEGFADTENGLSFVVSQNFIQGVNLEALAVSETDISIYKLLEQYDRIAKYLKRTLKFSPIGRDSFQNSNYIIEDLHLNNVKLGVDGNLYFIDTVISLNTPEDEFDGVRQYIEFDII